MKLKYIRFCFENCDSVTIDGKYIGTFLVDKFETSIRRIACNAINKMDCANRVVIEIHKNANTDYEEFGQSDWKRNIFKRLSGSDITSIDFELIENCPEDEKTAKIEKYDFYVDWIGYSDYSNDAQKVYISELGNLYLIICKDENIEDHFDKEDINDKESMSFHFDMCDVG